jgi:hypothetical protein
LFGKAVGRGHEGLDAQQQRYPRGRGEDIVRRLPHVHVIVRVHASIRSAWLAQYFGGAVREHFVRVHVVGSARARLVHVDDELIAQRAAEDPQRR